MCSAVIRSLSRVDQLALAPGLYDGRQRAKVTRAPARPPVGMTSPQRGPPRAFLQGSCCTPLEHGRPGQMQSCSDPVIRSPWLCGALTCEGKAGTDDGDDGFIKSFWLIESVPYSGGSMLWMYDTNNLR